jgi:hypothetical protein
MKRACVMGWAGVVMCAAAAWGQASSQPATKAGADFSNPRSTLTALYTSLRAGDVAGAMHAMEFADEKEAARVRMTLTTSWAPVGLMHAIEARFGEGTRRLFSNATLVKAADEALEKVETADISLKGDMAVVGEKRAAIDPNAETEVTGVRLHKTGEGWKVVAASFQDVASEVPANQLPTMQAMSEAIARASVAVKKRVEAGEFASAEEAYKAYQGMLSATERSQVPPPAAAPRGR